MESFVSRNEFFIPRASDGSLRLMLRDALILERPAGDDSGAELRRRMEGFTVFATLIIHGKKFTRLAKCVFQRFNDEPRIGGRNFDNKQDFKKDVGKKGGVVWTAANVRGFVLVKVSGRELEDVREFLRSLLLSTDGEDENEVVAEFGVGSLLCLQ